MFMPHSETQKSTAARSAFLGDVTLLWGRNAHFLDTILAVTLFVWIARTVLMDGHANFPVSTEALAIRWWRWRQTIVIFCEGAGSSCGIHCRDLTGSIPKKTNIPPMHLQSGQPLASFSNPFLQYKKQVGGQFCSSSEDAGDSDVVFSNT